MKSVSKTNQKASKNIIVIETITIETNQDIDIGTYYLFWITHPTTYLVGCILSKREPRYRWKSPKNVEPICA